MKKTLTTLLLATILTFGSTFANAGIIIAGVASNGSGDSCTDSSSLDTARGGIIIAGFTGIIIAGLTGIIIAGDKEEPQPCGIIIAG